MPIPPSPPWSYRCVAFDLDGLLVDTEPLLREVADRLLARRGQTVDETVLQAMMGVPARQSLPLLMEHHRLSGTVEEVAAECQQLFQEILGDRTAPLMPGARELVGRLRRRGVPRAIVTSSSAAYVRRVLTPHDLLPEFAFVLTSDDVTLGKPHPEVYAKAAARFGHDPREMVVLEDSPNGLRAAKSAGARCVVVPHAHVPRTALGGADAVVASLADDRLLTLLGV